MSGKSTGKMPAGPTAGTAVLRITRSRRAAFICVDEGKHGIDFRTAGHTGLFLSPLERLGNFIVPPSFPHELVPDVNLGLGRPAAFVEAPPQNLLVRSTFSNSP